MEHFQQQLAKRYLCSVCGGWNLIQTMHSNVTNFKYSIVTFQKKLKFFCLFLFEINSKFIYIRSAPSVAPLLNIFYNLFHLQEHIASTWNTSIDLDVWRNLYTVTTWAAFLLHFSSLFGVIFKWVFAHSQLTPAIDRCFFEKLLFLALKFILGFAYELISKTNEMEHKRKWISLAQFCMSINLEKFWKSFRSNSWRRSCNGFFLKNFP